MYPVNKVLSFIFLFISSVSCVPTYEISGSSSVNSLDGKMLYLKTIRDGEIVKIDSAEVVHGLFSMKGKTDSVVMATLYMDEVCIMPIVLEDGQISITIGDMDLKVVGTPLNEALYEFIHTRNEFEVDIRKLEKEETQMVLNGANYNDIHPSFVAKSDSLVKEMHKYVKNFIADNYETVLGTNIFLMLCTSLPYPVMTPEIEDIIKDAPHSFTNDTRVKEFLSKAKENMKLMEEQQRMQQNTSMTQ